MPTFRIYKDYITNTVAPVAPPVLADFPTIAVNTYNQITANIFFTPGSGTSVLGVNFVFSNDGINWGLAQESQAPALVAYTMVDIAIEPFQLMFAPPAFAVAAGLGGWTPTMNVLGNYCKIIMLEVGDPANPGNIDLVQYYLRGDQS